MTTRFLGLALGSNISPRASHIEQAVEKLQTLSCSDHFLQSSTYVTEPVDCPPGSKEFFNAVIEIECQLEPEAVLQFCQSIELEMGRPLERELNAPRPIDIDLLYYGEHRKKCEALTLPHPRAHQRLFVLEPLAEIRPDLTLPGQKLNVSELREQVLEKHKK